MKWVTFIHQDNTQIGFMLECFDQHYIIPIETAHHYSLEQRLPIPEMVDTMLELLESGEANWQAWRCVEESVKDEPLWIPKLGIPLSHVQLCAPIPRPLSVRDFYAFEEHVKKARARRGLEMVPEWYQFPVFYFSNPNAIIGPDQPLTYPKGTEKLDFELELACVIGKEGRDISIADAESYIFGYLIMNDWSARDYQAQEVRVGLGPAKGKDFATSLGPYLVTSDELAPYRYGEGRFQLEMCAYVNGVRISYGHFHHIHYTFAEMIARASQNVTLYPGEIIGSGTVGTGCILELGPEVHRWLLPSDVVTLTITGLGSLTNRIV